MLENPRNARVRAIAQLSQKTARLQSGYFLLEGPQAVREALTYRPELLTEFFGTPTALERHPELIELADAAGLPVEFATEQVIDAMADTVTPQGILAVCKQFPVALRRVFADAPKLVVVLQEVRDPGNAGTIIRAADAAGADAVIFAGRSVDLYNPKVVRSTTGSLFHVPIAVEAELGDVIARSREAGLGVFAADIRGESLLDARQSGVLAAPALWVFGNEARGLSAEDVARADRALQVPLFGRAESMNLATAAAVCLYESAFAQRLAAPRATPEIVA